MTGHAVSDVHERDGDPDIVSQEERIRVTVAYARGLRNADWGGKSDPYCLCQVQGRPDMYFQTATKDNDLNPDWDEVNDFLEYRSLDSIVFQIWDFDDVPCNALSGIIPDVCRKADDFLGAVTLTSDEIHRNGGYDGELALHDCGKNKHATLKVTIEFLDDNLAVIPMKIRDDSETNGVHKGESRNRQAGPPPAAIGVPHAEENNYKAGDVVDVDDVKLDVMERNGHYDDGNGFLHETKKGAKHSHKHGGRTMNLCTCFGRTLGVHCSHQARFDPCQK